MMYPPPRIHLQNYSRVLSIPRLSPLFKRGGGDIVGVLKITIKTCIIMRIRCIVFFSVSLFSLMAATLPFGPDESFDTDCFSTGPTGGILFAMYPPNTAPPPHGGLTQEKAMSFAEEVVNMGVNRLRQEHQEAATSPPGPGFLWLQQNSDTLTAEIYERLYAQRTNSRPSEEVVRYAKAESALREQEIQFRAVLGSIIAMIVPSLAFMVYNAFIMADDMEHRLAFIFSLAGSILLACAVIGLFILFGWHCYLSWQRRYHEDVWPVGNPVQREILNTFFQVRLDASPKIDQFLRLETQTYAQPMLSRMVQDMALIATLRQDPELIHLAQKAAYIVANGSDRTA